MRIQHNIMAMNSYRNYSQNTSALSKNLEKLSSGYKINRAGDDAAGLAISEKMRAQVTGLKAAQKNAKDGISLVQTAEGAMTEVHSMLNRMVDLADQSANGTYDNETDRANLQKEVTALKSEIDRIADSTNFNGIKLLDGSLSSTGATSAVATLSTKLATTDIAATKGVYKTDAINSTLAAGQKVKVSIGLDNGKSVDIELTYTADKKFVDANGNEYGATGAGATSTQGETNAAILAALKDTALGKDFDITLGTNALEFTAKNAGTGAPKVTSVGVVSNGTAAAQKITETAAEDAKIGIADGSFTAFTGANASAAIFELNGKKFVIADTSTGGAAVDVSKLDKDVTVISGDMAADQASIAQQLAKATGMTVEVDANAGGTGVAGYTFSAGKGTSGSGGLTLQIGDTADSFNQLTVSVSDMHTKSLGINSIDISTQEGAKAAVDVIKAAINSVSSTRGDLGATQNRLEHTINNLSVMTENIQDAEANIRDVDVAEEMMSYTKNNILVQSAQAMLAQANQIPQGVLQLLQ